MPDNSVDESVNNDNSTISEIVRNLRRQSEGQNDLASGAFQEMSKADPGMSTSDAMYSGLTGLVPLIIGLLKGKPYQMANLAQAATLGPQMIEKSAKEDSARQKVLAEKTYMNILKNAENLEKRAGGLEDTAAKIKYKAEVDPEKGPTVNINNTENRPYSTQEQQLILGPIGSMNDIASLKESVADTIMNASPDQQKLLTSRIVNKDGTKNLDNLGKYFVEDVNAGLFGTAVPYGEIKQQVLDSSFYKQLLQSGKASAEPEFRRITKLMSGKGLAPQDIPALFDNLTKLSTKLEEAGKFANQFVSASHDENLNNRAKRMGDLLGQAKDRGISMDLVDFISQRQQREGMANSQAQSSNAGFNPNMPIVDKIKMLFPNLGQ